MTAMRTMPAKTSPHNTNPKSVLQRHQLTRRSIAWISMKVRVRTRNQHLHPVSFWLLGSTGDAETCTLSFFAIETEGHVKPGKRKRSSKKKQASQKQKKNAKKRRNDNRACRRQYDSQTQEVIDVASDELNARILTNSPMAEDEEIAIQAAHAWDNACKATGHNIKLDGELVAVVRISSHGCVKHLISRFLVFSWSPCLDHFKVVSKGRFVGRSWPNTSLGTQTMQTPKTRS
jgi:hypothetical protein